MLASVLVCFVVTLCAPFDILIDAFCDAFVEALVTLLFPVWMQLTS